MSGTAPVFRIQFVKYVKPKTILGSSKPLDRRDMLNINSSNSLRSSKNDTTGPLVLWLPPLRFDSPWPSEQHL